MEHSFYFRVPLPVNLISNQECKIAFEQDKLKKTHKFTKPGLKEWLVAQKCQALVIHGMFAIWKLDT